MLSHDKLFEFAQEARKRAIAPYSKFQVGAVVVTTEGKIFSGCNIEVSSYGLTLCAERVALFKALSEGEKNFSQIAVIADIKDEPCFPCGACRQVLWDFAPNAEIFCANTSGKIQVFQMSDLIPYAFGSDNLSK